MDQKGPFKKGQIEDPIIATASPDAAMLCSQSLIHQYPHFILSLN